MRHAPLPVAALTLALSLRASFGEGSWPRFRGPNGTGVSEATTVPVKWTAKDYNWTVKLPGGLFLPVQVLSQSPSTG